MKKIFKRKNVLTLLGVGLGMMGGFLYWKYVGCATGTCPITSSPMMSTIWGGLMGGLLLNMFEPARHSGNNK